MKQQSIQGTATLSGVGLHFGEKATITLKPASANQGIVFVRVDLPNKPIVKVEASTVWMDESVSRCTALDAYGVRIFTVEHLLAAFRGLNIDNIIVEIDAQEVPGMDGSSADFVAALKKCGIVELAVEREIYDIKEPIVVASKTASLTIIPSDKFSIAYTLDYNHPSLRSQFFSVDVDQQSFEQQLSQARTFCLESEAEEIRARGLGKGATHQNSLVMSAKGPLENTLRYPDECARHKALDILGDLSLLGYQVRGTVYATKSGHSLNRALVKKIEEQRKKYAVSSYVSATKEPTGKRTFGIDQIMKILPHRYPFLLVDRVIEVEQGLKGIGIKNVTINDGFFQGHFPVKPVMPGVLMVEAIAQTAGVILLTSGIHDGKVALFMSIKEVKFRKVVVPGDQLVMEIEILRNRERTAHVKGIGKVDGEPAVEAEMMFSYTDAAYLYGG